MLKMMMKVTIFMIALFGGATSHQCGLYLAKSTIDGAGLGVFTGVPRESEHLFVDFFYLISQLSFIIVIYGGYLIMLRIVCISQHLELYHRIGYSSTMNCLTHLMNYIQLEIIVMHLFHHIS